MATASSQAIEQLRQTMAHTLHASLSTAYLSHISMAESQNCLQISIISSVRKEFLEQKVAHISHTSAQLRSVFSAIIQTIFKAMDRGFL
jgi:hypothetical protein